MKTLFFKPFKKHKKSLYWEFKIGSSETTREAPYLRYLKKTKTFYYFDFQNYFSFAPSHVKNRLNPHFLEWFIGFVEGDGTFSIRKNKGLKPRLVFEIGQKDPKVLYFIKKTLGFGSVNSWQRNETTYWVYRVNSKKNIQRIIQLFNGNLVLTKRKVQFEKWLKAAKLWNFLPQNFRNSSVNAVVKDFIEPLR